VKEPSDHHETKKPADYLEILYRRHFQGAIVRSGASLIMWVFALAAYLANVIKINHFTGITLSVLYLILINPPTLLILKRITHTHLFGYASLLINFLEILGYTAIIHFLGGIEATFLTPIYAALITYVGVMAPRGFTYFIAFLCSAAFSFVVGGEYFGLLTHHAVIQSFDPTGLTILTYLSVVIGLLFVVAYISSLTAGILKKNRNKLREQNLELVEKTASLEKAEKELLTVHNELESRVAERTADLREATDRLLREIRERKQAEDALRESENRLRTIVEGTQALLANVDAKGHFTYANSATARAVGYASPEELIGKSYLHFIHPEDRQQVLDTFIKQVNTRQPSTMQEFRITDTEGKTKWFSFLSTLAFKDGQFVGQSGVAQDITDHKQAEDALRESEERFKALFEKSADAQILVDHEGKMIDCNDAHLVLFGLQEKSEILGHSPNDFAPAHQPNGTPSSEMGNKILTAVLEKGSARFEWAHQKHDPAHTPILTELSCTLIRIANRPMMHVVIRDITARKQAEEEKAKIEEQYHQAQKMEAIGQLAGGVAHDFNNMLNIILGYSQLALLKIEPSSPLKADLQEIMNATKRSTDLVRQLLAFARKQTIAPKAMDLNDAVAGVLNMLRKLIGEDIDLLWMPAANLWPVKMDPTQIDQVLANLAVNARDSISGVGKITIETGKAEFDDAYCAQHAGFVPGHYAMLAVSDNGCGMDKETCEKIFEPFFTTKEVGKGTGMGLATVYGIVKQNNGIVNVYSEPGKGTTFKIYLPRHGEDEEVIDGPRAQAKSLTGTETVLLVEDEETLLEMGKIMLEELGYTVLAAGSPNEAIKLAEQYAGDFHLLVTDVVMPEMSGRDLQKRLSALRPDMKYLFMSGYTANVIAHRGILDEGVNFLQKPFLMEELAAKVREALE